MDGSPLTDEALRHILGPNITRYRVLRGVKQEGLAAGVGYANHTTITNIEHGRTLPTVAKFVAIGRYLQIPLDLLVDAKQEVHEEEARRIAFLAARIPQPLRLAVVVLLEALGDL